MMRRAEQSLLALALAASLLACGPDASDRKTNSAPMTPNAGPLARTPADVDVPAIVAVRFEPAQPRAGHSVRALPEIEAGGPMPQLGYAWTLNGRRLASTTDSVDLPDSRSGDRLEVVVTPRLGARSGTPFTESLRLGSPAPRIMGISLVPRHGLTAGSRVTARPLIDGVDAGSVSLRHVWYVNGRAQSEREASFSTEGLRRGDRVQVEITARFAGQETAPHRSEELVLENAPPQLSSEPLAQEDDGRITTRLIARDPDGDAPLRFRLEQGPPGLELDRTTGRIHWDPTEAVAGHHVVRVQVSDPDGATASAQFELTVDEPTPAAPAPR